MADRIRTVDFLPEIFQTPVNRQFLSATLDQLTQEPKFEKTEGFIGRTVGPGVNPDDRYVIEPTKTRTDYQLEPGVISVDPTATTKITSAITYPGINDALQTQGAFVNDADRLYVSDYYTFDPFCDFDKFVNYSQYYWLPQGPDPVDIFAVPLPITDTITVIRDPETSSYSFQGVTETISGNNPDLTLIRGGSYNFKIAQNNSVTEYYTCSIREREGYVIELSQFPEVNPTLTLTRGNTYVFQFTFGFGVETFFIKTEVSKGTTNLWSQGVTGNGGVNPDSTITFTVPVDAPDTLFYCDAAALSNFQGQINIIDPEPDTGPAFWIQQNPGVSGKLDWAPNLTARDIVGVNINPDGTAKGPNGIDFGTINFTVPDAIAQSFFYDLNPLPNVDLVCGTGPGIPTFSQLNNITVSEFLVVYDGIDGITNINNRTIIFPDDTDPAISQQIWVARYFNDGTNDRIALTVQSTPNVYDKFLVQFGDVYSNTQWYKDAFSSIVRIPSLNAIEDTFYYQDGQDPAMFGTIKIVDQSRQAELEIIDIVGNGSTVNLKFPFQSVVPFVPGQFINIANANPPSYNGLYSVVNCTLELVSFVSANTELYIAGGTVSGGKPDPVLNVLEILGRKNYTSPNGVEFTNGLIVTFAGSTTPAEYKNQSYFVEGVGTAIKLLDVRNFVTPEPYTISETIPYDSTLYDERPFDGSLNAPLEPDYVTINRGSIDLNPWSRSNRWFHIDTINAAAKYNNTVTLIDNAQRGRRPIIEFRANTRLFNFGSEGQSPVSVIDFTITNGLLVVNGQTEYTIDGFRLTPGARIIFAADTDPQVRNKIYQVEFIQPQKLTPYPENIDAQPIINLVQVGTMLIDQVVLCTNGLTLQGTNWTWDGVNYIRSQVKTTLNQAPLFNVYDAQGISYGDRAKYPSSNFLGSKLFSYAIGNGAADAVLKFPLKFFSLSNLADIVFDNNLYVDSFEYVRDNVGFTEMIKNGFVRQYINRTEYINEIGWQTGVTKSICRQQFRFVYDGTPLKLDIPVSLENVVPAIQMYINSNFQDPSTYTYEITLDNQTIVTITSKAVVPGSVIELQVISDFTSKQGFYTVPINLENNALNINSPSFTLGTIRSHYKTICENLVTLQGPIDGANNTRDLGNIVPYGLQILQQSAPLTLAGYFMRSEEYDIFGALEYNGREYIKFKTKLLETVVTNDYGTMTIPEVLDAAIADITLGRTDINPFYWSDMLPTGPVFSQTIITVNPVTGRTFNTKQVYNFKSANFLGLLVYVNDVLLVRGRDYVVSAEGPTFTILTPLAVGDKITIDEYNNTAGSFVPNTPSKMGLYPKYVPEIYYDTTYVNPTFVILGHDGSKTVAFDDYRTEVLLEFEKRIYNNIKLDDNPVPLTTASVSPDFFTERTLNVLPGYFRNVDYSTDEINSILNESFLSWVGWNKLDYRTQDYIANSAFTWNYSQSGDKLSGEPLLGAWRGIYRYFYDTETPNTTPWEMLGFSEEPDWWVLRYGPAPYTSGNLVLWDDLEIGYVADPVAPFIAPEYARPGLSQVIPAGTEGELLPPDQTVMGYYDPGTFKKSWAVDDGGPVEASWWTSSSYPFAVMRLLALTRPAEFFSLFADRDLYKYDKAFGQYLYNGRFRLDANGLVLYGDGVSKASYINWIIDYNKQLGINSTKNLTAAIQNLDVRLCYRMASFSDKGYMKIFCERSSPNSDNASLLIPDQSYQLLLYKNVPFESIEYSAVVVEVVEGGYQVYGYSNIRPFFTIQVSSSSGLQQTIEVADKTVRVPAQYTDNTANIPYGTTFINDAAVVDFILSYGKSLETKGLVYAGRENGYTLNWYQMAQEFLYFAQQGWSVGTLINLNPSSRTLRAVRPGAVADTILSLTPENMLLDQNRATIATRDLIVERYGNELSVSSPGNQTISFLKLKFTSYEHMIVLDNVTVFDDLIYDPVTAARQSRVKLVAATSTEWNGTLDAQGFILNDNNVKQWESNKKYAKGEIVIYKNIYYSAQTIVQPKIEFDYNDWVKSEYSIIQQGLLPNITNKADQLANTYNTQIANLDTDNDLFAYGLIGYRPRQYMAELNLDDVTQVQLYQQFLGTKGTLRAAEIFTRAQFGSQSGAYTIYENWATLVATYGAQANKSFVEYRLNAALLQSNPSIIQVIQSQQVSEADQKILLADVWRESYKLTSTNILPTTFDTDPETSLPSAGYVNFNDADITVFSLNDPSSISAYLDSIGIGTTIWVAKVNSYDWGIFRCESVPGVINQLSDNLNSTAVATFTEYHGLSIGDTIIIKYFNESVNGVYRVLSIPSNTTIVIAYDFNNSSQTTIYSDGGLAFYLQTMRVKQASDVASLPYANSLTPGVKVWVDNDGNGRWVVLEKQEPFVYSSNLTSQDFNESIETFGASVAQSKNVLNLLVGAPGTGIDRGELFIYRKDNLGVITPNTSLVLSAPEVSGFGNSLKYGNNNWLMAGANRSRGGVGYAAAVYQSPTSSAYSVAQILTPENLVDIGNFGTAVTISVSERWAYVSAPLLNKVYAYGIVPIQNQIVNYLGDGTTVSFNFADSILINKNLPGQLFVIVGNRALSGINNGPYDPLDYVIDPANNNNIILLGDPPAEGTPISIRRRNSVPLDQYSYFDVPQGDFSTTTGSGALFNIKSTRGQYSITLIQTGSGYTVGDTLIINGSDIGGTDIANSITITVTQIGDQGELFGYNSSGQGNGSTTSFDLGLSLYTATTPESFTVVVNGTTRILGLDYTFAGTTLTFTGYIPPFGASITVNAAAYWSRSHIIDGASLDGIGIGSRFGESLSTSKLGRTVVIGAPKADGLASISGAAYVFDRSVIKIVVTDPEQMTYTFPGNYTQPINELLISVLVNNVYLNNANQAIPGQYVVDGINQTITLLPSVTLIVGDIIEIETNNFSFIEKLISNVADNEAEYGRSVVISETGSTILTGAPRDSSILIESGSVDRQVSLPQVYGTITSTVANPTLVSGSTIRVNDVQVAVPLFPGNTIAGLVNAINSANVPNAVAASTPDLTFTTDGSTRSYFIGALYASAAQYNTVVYLNNVLQTPNLDYTYDTVNETINFITPTPPRGGLPLLVVSGRITISVKNPTAALPDNLLTVLPGTTNSIFSLLGFNIYESTETLVSPYPTTYAYFGQTITTNPTATTLIVGAPNGTVYEPMEFDFNQTIFDERSTTFFSPVEGSGVVYSYDYLPSASDSIADAGQFVFGEQIFSTNIASGQLFGTALEYITGELIVGAPATETNGYAAVFNNPTDKSAWFPIYRQLPVVDVRLINAVYMYDSLISSTQTYLDFFDPLQGKILAAARRNIDYLGAVDPARYNTGPIRNNGNSWGNEHVGEIWWDTDTVRFVDPNQDDLVYASRRWGQVFPGSRIDIYQWVSSPVPPVEYTGPGIPLSVVSYTVKTYLNQQSIFVTEYYFWAREITSIDTGLGKTLSPVNIANYIRNPKSSGIPYMAPLTSSAIAIYNSVDLLSAFDTIIHIDYDREYNDDNIHTEYQLIADGKPAAFLNDALYRKMQDSFCGVDTFGNSVPDPFLSPSEKYGVQFRPRQSMFIDRFTALENYLGHANAVLIQFPISETKNFNLLNSQDPIPSATSGEWDKEVANLQELAYQDIFAVPLGYKYLVLTDTDRNGLWTIYIVNSVGTGTLGERVLTLYRVQSFDTKQYWSYVNWYRPGYNSTVQPLAEVPNRNNLDQLSIKKVPVGSSARVTSNSQGLFEIYLRTSIATWERVGLQNGTIQFDASLWDYQLGRFGFDAEVFDAQYYDQEPTVETRQIIRAINEELFTDELLIERNRSLMFVFNYVYSEFKAPTWLMKTSLVDVNHEVSTLEPTQIYQQDNQNFILDYIQEVKPYHVQIREFNLAYSGFDEFTGYMTDFDNPAFYDTTLEVPQYISPILLPYTQAQTTVRSNISDRDENAQIWQLQPWKEWYDNYALGVSSIDIINTGRGYTSQPRIEVIGYNKRPAKIIADLDGTGKIIGTIIVDPGQYLGEVSVVIIGGGGNSAEMIANLTSPLVRSIKTVIKYDRTQYRSDVVEWLPNIDYPVGTLVRNQAQVFETTSPDNAGPTFNFEYFTLVPINELSGVNRTMGYYVPGPNMPGLSLPLLINGVEYPGVQVYGPPFLWQGSNILAYNPEALDAIYTSEYADADLGTRPTDVNVTGDDFISPYASYAPEELVPGAEFDTLDFRVYSRPGQGSGSLLHGFPLNSLVVTYNSTSTTYSYAGLMPYPVEIIVTNVTLGVVLPVSSYSIDWLAQTVTINSGATNDDVLVINVYGIGGGNQLYKNVYDGGTVYAEGNIITIPVKYSELIPPTVPGQNPAGLVLFVDGAIYNNFSTTEVLGSTSLEINLFNNLAGSQINVTALGPTYLPNETTVDYSWSTPQTETITATGTAVYSLTNTMEYTNYLNAIVMVNGVRYRTAAAIEYLAEQFAPRTYSTPPRIVASALTILDSDIIVYVNNVLQVQGINYTLTAATVGSTTRTVTFTFTPKFADQILIYVTTDTDARITGQTLTFTGVGSPIPASGDRIEVISWNDDRQQNILPQVYVGPVYVDEQVDQPYDSTRFDVGNVNGEPGSYDFSTRILVERNNLILARPVTNPSRLWVTLNGRILSPGYDFVIENNQVVLANILAPTDVVMIEYFTESVVRNESSFRIFQNMRGLQLVYTITPETTTVLTEALFTTDDIIYVADASALPEPNLSLNIWGAITINGERIMYRERDTGTNTLTGLLRGTAGTATNIHGADSIVYSIGLDNLLPPIYQNYFVTTTDIGDGTQKVFVASNIYLG